MRTLVLILCLVPGLACAGSLYRCIGPAGNVSYQSDACPSGHRTSRTIDFVPDPVSPAPSVSPAVVRKRQPSTRSSRSRYAASAVRKPRPSPCALAKAKRESQLERLGLKRTFDDLSRIDSAVRTVCKGY
ncbi:MAG: DUF4124 domain-containing protein [Lysobacteraceae bacterium]|nr:MAG: DUF4124 domain-containing protein [Xanthomonadaceae bacterium]